MRQIEKALRIQEQCFLELFGVAEEGTTEREAAAQLRFMMVRAGADDQAFEPLFQFGSHSSLPHGRATGRVLRGEAHYAGGLGREEGRLPLRLDAHVFSTVLSPPGCGRSTTWCVEAQGRAISRIAPGVPFAEVDAAAREVIRQAGYGKAFGHSTGHGLGLDMHEPPSAFRAGARASCARAWW